MRHATLIVGLLAAMAGASTTLRSQETSGTQAQGRRFLAPPAQVIAIRAGRLFDAKSGAVLNDQVVLIKGDRITDIGAGLQIPRDARIVNLSAATVLPGMIDTHVHLNTGGETPAQRAHTANGCPAK